MTSPSSPHVNAAPASNDLPRFTTEDLNAAYNQYVYAPNREQLMARWVTLGEQAVQRIGEPSPERYGNGEHETLEIFRASSNAAPVHIHFRGGGWRYLVPRREHGFLSEMFVRAGAHFVLPDFEGADRNGGDLMPIADQVLRAVAWVHSNAKSFGGDPAKIYVSGHSTGGHLASIVATADWSPFRLPRDIVKGVLCSSGVYDVAPAILSGRFPHLKFNEDTARALTTLHSIERLSAPIVVSYTTLETPGFRRQGRDFAAALRKAGKPLTEVVTPHYNHLEILETLATPHGLLGALALQQMGLR